jgi:sugar (pentulose or hexulose) kinase
MTTNRQQVKSSMQFLGHLHQVISSDISSYFEEEDDFYKQLKLNKELCERTLSYSKKIFFPDGIREDYKTDLTLLHNYSNYESAYYQLLFEISHLVFEAIELILDKENKLEDIYISGGFNKNQLFVHYLSLVMPDKKIKISDIKNESALGAALLMKDHLE